MTLNKSCLLIDNDPDDQLLFSLVVEKMDCAVRCVTTDNGLYAIRQLERDPSFVPDFIFLGLCPGRNGIDFLIKIKGLSCLAHIPVVIYTNSSSSNDILEAKKHGAADFITKTHDISGLMVKLKELFSSEKVHDPGMEVSFRSSGKKTG